MLASSSALDWNRTNDTGFRRAVLYPLSYEGGRPRWTAGGPAPFGHGYKHTRCPYGFRQSAWRACHILDRRQPQTGLAPRTTLVA